ncbi:succinyl-diaminopimelate desuccinylase [Staphylococcus aureus]|uniref:Probable succinyl-diaminopimelate desuccinylase n=3 Tax=Staphylococcus aureus TaxID=1280 RepID=A0A1S6BAQ0_STAAU|nr:ArgE/DapE family deacylase [Staphylococcus aureus]EHS12770.1 succinyl-diaminopimelate desuccinylase [Staphylococcus aureus subsp. aureus IS-24]EHS18888.1 succinyl-diaminopimelate desuccinylase [Staphylococcus aureus subsp. aureus IS-91]EID88063.1 succinyl-diaminopimelate desuccinylase [Staphylococcus aureus subsp. aureus CO-23]EZI22381.1 peptidase, ArgE/DapE family [Staphylococcus aureus subsp. aureus CO-85]HAR4237677.1 ArgE/DapE family deacylase [Staphylococcus aureus ADL-121]HDK9115189.1
MTTFSEKEKIQLLADIVELQTENNNEIDVCNYLTDLFDKYDIKSEILKVNEHRANIVAEIGNGSPILALSGHMDVVDAGNQDNWSYPPFQLTEKDGKLYGRGTTDMKGGLMALVVSLIELKEQNELPHGTIRLLATAGEEKEQEGAKLLADKGYLDDVDSLIIAEPTGSGIYYAHKGSMSCKVTATGKAVHSSVPFIGDNAIDTLLEFYNLFKEKYSELKQQDTKHELDVAPMFKSLIGKEISEEDANYASGLTAVCSIINGGKQFNSVPDEASLEFNVRPVPEYDNDFIESFFQNIINDVDSNKLSLDIPSNHRPVTSDKNSKLITTIKDVASSYVEQDEIFVSALVGATDASSFLGDNKDNVDLAIFGPGNPLMAHQIDEYIEKDMYLKYIDIFKEASIQYLKEK